MSDSFTQLKQDIKSCRLCETELPLGSNPILRFHPNARILVAGQAPGIRVHKTSIPFNDPSGVRLRDWMGIDESTFYDESQIAIIPMGFCYPGTGKYGDLPPLKTCSLTWHKKILQQLPNIQLTLAIGQYSQKYYLDKNRKHNLTETVKSWKNFLPEIIPLPHPSPRNNIWLKKNPWFEQEVLNYLKQKVLSILE